MVDLYITDYRLLYRIKRLPYKFSKIKIKLKFYCTFTIWVCKFLKFEKI